MSEKQIRKKKCRFFSLHWHDRYFGFTDSHKEEKLKVQSVKTYEDFYKKGMVYFYGNERTEKDLTLAGQYFKKEETNKKKTEAYLLLIEVLNDPEKEVKQDELVCQSIRNLSKGRT